MIDHMGTPRGDDPPPLRITRAGLQAIGVETEGDTPEAATPGDTGATPADAAPAALDGPATPPKRKGKAKEPKAGKARAGPRPH
jgi:hypothetical protein